MDWYQELDAIADNIMGVTEAPVPKGRVKVSHASRSFICMSIEVTHRSKAAQRNIRNVVAGKRPSTGLSLGYKIGKNRTTSGGTQKTVIKADQGRGLGNDSDTHDPSTNDPKGFLAGTGSSKAPRKSDGPQQRNSITENRSKPTRIEDEPLILPSYCWPCKAFHEKSCQKYCTGCGSFHSPICVSRIFKGTKLSCFLPPRCNCCQARHWDNITGNCMLKRIGQPFPCQRCRISGHSSQDCQSESVCEPELALLRKRS